MTFEEIRADKTREWALRYGILETIRAAIDLASHLVSRNNLGNPATYAECIALLEKSGYIDTSLAQRLIGTVGLRNRLIHEYTMIDLEKLYRFLWNVDDFATFVREISPHLK